MQDKRPWREAFSHSSKGRKLHIHMVFWHLRTRLPLIQLLRAIFINRTAAMTGHVYENNPERMYACIQVEWDLV